MLKMYRAFSFLGYVWPAMIGVLCSKYGLSFGETLIILILVMLVYVSARAEEGFQTLKNAEDGE